MVPLLATLALAPREIDGEDAVRIARAFLIRMGVSGFGELGSLMESPIGGWPGVKGRTWGVGFEAKEGRGFSVVLDERGTVFYASTAGRPGAVPTDLAKARRIGQRLMARVPNAHPTRQDPDDPGTFRNVVDRRIYFNLNPTYGYRLSFDAAGNLTWFGRKDRPPKPATRIPRLSGTTATKRLTAVWQATEPGTWPYPRRIEPELGYYSRKGEPTARLVWRGRLVWTDPYSHRTNTLTTLTTFVDAVSGISFEADDR